MRPSVKGTISIVCLLLCNSAGADSGSEPRAFLNPGYWIAQPLGSLGGQGSEPRAVNATGDVAGFAGNGVTTHAFLYAGGAMRDVGTLSGGARDFSEGTGVNASGTVVGYSGTVNENSNLPNGYYRAFRTTGAGLADLGDLGGTTSTFARGINDDGQIVGESPIPGDTNYHAFLWTNGTIKDIGTLGGGFSRAWAINNSGVVVGESSYSTTSPLTHAFSYSAGVMKDLGSLADPSAANAISSVGAITGVTGVPQMAGTPSVLHAFLWTNGVMKDLGAMPGYPNTVGNGINTSGDIVGAATSLDQSMSRAFVVSALIPVAMGDLNNYTWGLGSTVLTAAYAINDRRQIVATGCGPLAICQAFLLNPVEVYPDQPPAVPVVEYYHAAFNHYFMTADPTEMATLDNGVIPGWTRTGQSFGAYRQIFPGLSPVCRLFNNSFAPLSSHFYSAQPNECFYAETYPGWAWQLEGIAMYANTPNTMGGCATGLSPVYRLYNNGQGGAPNHRYTTSLEVRSAMLAQGWVPEGNGPQGVVMCAPSLS